MKAFYTAGVIYDTLMTFGELSEEATDKRKYAKYKAAYIHNCLKNGEMPIPGPPHEDGESDDNNVVAGPSNSDNADTPPEAPADEPSASEPNDPAPHTPIEFTPHPNPTEINGNHIIFIFFFSSFSLAFPIFFLLSPLLLFFFLETNSINNFNDFVQIF